MNPFNVGQTAGTFFAGRERQLTRLHALLDGLDARSPANICVVGRGGEGKTSYLERAVADANTRNFIACRCVLDIQKSAERDIDTIMHALLRAVDARTSETLDENWKSGDRSSFETPRLKEIRADELGRDFASLSRFIAPKGAYRGYVVCVDEAQRISPIALAALKNALQGSTGSCYMFILSILNVSDTASNEDQGQATIRSLAQASGDPGAGRFFQANHLPLGPFDSVKEGEECINKRLQDAPIQFEPTLVSQICRVAGRYPDTIIQLSSATYEYARETSTTPASVKTFRDAFFRAFGNPIRQASRFAEGLSAGRKSIYREVLELDGEFTPLDVATRLLQQATGPLSPDDLTDTVVRPALELLATHEFAVRTAETKYRVCEPVRAHALRLALT